MKLKRLSSLMGLLAVLLIFTGGRVLAVDAIAVSDAQSFPGGTDTVEVNVTTDDLYLGADIVLSYDKTLLSTTEASVIVNEEAWNPSWGEPSIAVDTTVTPATISVGMANLTGNFTQGIPQSSSALELFSVVFTVDSSASGSITITPTSGMFIDIDLSDPNDAQPIEVDVSYLVAGTFTVQSLYNMTVDSVEVGPGALVPVNVNLSNGTAINAVEFTITYDSSQVVYADSIVVPSGMFSSGSNAVEVIDHGDSITVSINSTDYVGEIGISNELRSIASVYFITADSADVTIVNNPLVLSANTTVVTNTGAPSYDFVDNTPNMVNGNLAIESKYSLRVGDAAAPQGGSDTVSVYLTTAEDLYGAEVTIYFDDTKFSVSDANVTINGGIFGTSGVSEGISTTDTSITVMLMPSDPVSGKISSSDTEKMLFSMIVDVAETAAGGYATLTAEAIVIEQVALGDFEEITVTSITNGSFRVMSAYELEVKSRYALPVAQNIPVSVLMTNAEDIYSADVVIRYDTSYLEYVDESVEVISTLWSGGMPDVNIVADGDSVVISLYDLNDVTNKIAGGGAQNTLLTLGFNVKSALTIGSSTTLTPSGLFVGADANLDLVEYTPAGVAGTVTVRMDITPPKPVTNASATPGTSTIMLAWKNPSDSDLDYVKVVRNNGADSTTVVMDNSPVLGASKTFEDVTIAQGVEYYYTFIVADDNGNIGKKVVVGPVSIGPATRVKVNSITALAGGMARSKIKVTSPNDNVGGLMFTLTFDNTVMQMTDMAAGPDAAGLVLVSDFDVDTVNTYGVLNFSALDTLGTSPVTASSTAKTVLIMYFAVAADAVTGSSSALTLSSVSMSDPTANDISISSVVNGTVSIVGNVELDMNSDGSINIGDLWYYINREELVPFESLAELVNFLLAQPMPTSMLAAADAVATYSTAIEGAAGISLSTDFEISAARFTFNYDHMQQVSEVYLNQALAGSVMIKKVVADGKLYVDIISLGGIIPAEAGELFSVSFVGVDHEAAGLVLDKVEVADRNGNVTLEAVQDNRVVLPKAYALSQNSPNPFNPSTTIKYQVPEGEAAKVRIVVYNVRGQKIITLVDELKESGDYTVNWNGTNTSGQRVSSGVYFYRMSAGDFSAMRKMVIVK